VLTRVDPSLAYLVIDLWREGEGLRRFQVE
jgi:hypothetical protein